MSVSVATNPNCRVKSGMKEDVLHSLHCDQYQLCSDFEVREMPEKLMQVLAEKGYSVLLLF